MSLHTIKPEVYYPAMMPDVLQGIANFLWRYTGSMPVAILRKTKQVYYWDNHWYRWPHPEDWANVTSYGAHLFDWNDVYVVNDNDINLETLALDKEYIRHD